MSGDTIRRRAPASAAKTENDGDDQTLYEPPDGVPAGTIFFRYNKFQHNSRLAFFMVPCASLLAIFGGQTTMATLIGGILIIYLNDFYGWKESTFVAIWVTVTSVVMTLIMSSLHLFSISIFNIALVYNMLIFACGVGLLFAIMPSSPPVILTWSAVATYGMESAPYYLMVFMAIGYMLYVMPTRSSYRVLGKGKSKRLGADLDELDELVMGRLESAVHTVSFVMLPVFFKFSIHHTHLVASKDDVADLLLLSCLPLLLVVCLAGRGSLWWLGLSASAIASVRRVLTAVLVLVVVGCLEVRVVFHSLAQYIKLVPPLDWIAVTFGVYLVTLLGLAHFGGVITSPRMTPLVTVLGAVAIGCGCVALGVPLYMVPFGSAGAFFCTRFYYHRRLQDYCSFVGTAALVIFWFVIRTFMFLDFEFDPLPMSLKHVCLVLMAVVLASLLIPGLVAVNTRLLWVNGLVLCVHAAGVNLLELQLHCQFKGIYPPYLVVFTSALGVYLAHHLYHEGRVLRLAAWAMGCLYAGKLGLLFHPTPLALPASLALVFSISPMYLGMAFLTGPVKGGGGGGGGGSAQGGGADGGRLSKGGAVGLMAGAAAALFATRHSVVAAAVRATIHHSSPESLLLGVIAVAWALACSGVSVYHLPQSPRLRRGLAVVLCAGAILALVQPDTEFVRPLSPIRTAPVAAAAAARGGGAAAAGRYPSYCLFCAAVCALLTLGDTARRSCPVLLGLAGTAGALVGVYFDGAMLPYPGMQMITSALACAMAAVTVAFVLAPAGVAAVGGGSMGVSLLLSGVYTLFVAVLPVTLLSQPMMLRAVPAGVRGEALAGHRVGFMGLYAALSLLIAAAVKLRAAQEAEGAGGGRARGEGAAAAAAAQGPRRGVVAVGGKGGEFDWIPAAGNLATVMAYVLAIVIGKGYMEAPDEVVVGLAPVLLLLSRDNGLFAGLGDRNRYFPLVAASIGWLVATAAFRLSLREPLERYRLIPRGAGPYPETASLLALVKNVGMLSVVLPGHALFSRFMWNFRQTRDLYWVLLLPLNVLPMLLADLSSLRLLGALGIAAGALQLFLSSRIRKHGLQFV